MNRQKINKKKQNKKVSRARPDLELHPTFKGQPVASFKTFDASQVVTTSGAGVVALSIHNDPVTQVNTWSTRFQTMFDEYRVIKCRWQFRCFNSTTPGVLNMFIDEKSSGAPVSADSQKMMGLKFNSSDVTKVHVLDWTPSDPRDLEYNDCATSVPADAGHYLKLYTDTANWGSPVSTALGVLNCEYTLQLRGYDV
jgi:hypothetical protein